MEAKMAWARSLAILVIVIMSGFMLNILLHDSMGHGVGMDTFNAGMTNPWRAFIGQDLVSGLFFTVAWLVYRERGGRVLDTIAWAWMAFWWGNIVIAVYILVAVSQSRGDPAMFFLGRRAGDLHHIWRAPSLPLRGLCALSALLVAAYLVRGLTAVQFSGIAAFGYTAGFLPVILSLVLLAMPAKTTRTSFT
jgi:hypothetical protein